MENATERFSKPCQKLTIFKFLLFFFLIRGKCERARG